VPSERGGIGISSCFSFHECSPLLTTGSLTLTIPKRRLDGCACTSPLAHFYIHHSGSSIRELHPFTTITHLASRSGCTPVDFDSITIQFLFRKRGRKQELTDAEIRAGKEKRLLPWNRKFWDRRIPPPQWTNKLASLVDGKESEISASLDNDSRTSTQGMALSTVSTSAPSLYEHPTASLLLRLEGPYFTPAYPANYKSVICLVAGTGISGAIAIANAFIERQNSTSPCGPSQRSKFKATGGEITPTTHSIGLWERCIIVWSVKEEDYLELPFVKASPESGLEIRTHLTGGGRQRLDIKSMLEEESDGTKDNVWVYISGPNRFIEAAEEASKATPGVAYYGARWDI
jgi:hypothetical protein